VCEGPKEFQSLSRNGRTKPEGVESGLRCPKDRPSGIKEIARCIDDTYRKNWWNEDKIAIELETSKEISEEPIGCGSTRQGKSKNGGGT